MNTKKESFQMLTKVTNYTR